MKKEKIADENQLYDAILARISSGSTTPKEDTRWEGQTYVELMRILKSGQEPSDGAVRNSILLMLALINPRTEGVDLWGTDLQKMSAKDRQQLIFELLDALPAPVSQ